MGVGVGDVGHCLTPLHTTQQNTQSDKEMEILMCLLTLDCTPLFHRKERCPEAPQKCDSAGFLETQCAYPHHRGISRTIDVAVTVALAVAVILLMRSHCVVFYK